MTLLVLSLDFIGRFNQEKKKGARQIGPSNHLIKSTFAYWFQGWVLCPFTQYGPYVSNSGILITMKKCVLPLLELALLVLFPKYYVFRIKELLLIKMEIIPFNCSFAMGRQHIFALSWKTKNHKDGFLLFFSSCLVILFLSFRQASLLSMILRDKLKVVLIWSFSLCSLLISWTNVLLPSPCVFKSWKNFEKHPVLKKFSSLHRCGLSQIHTHTQIKSFLLWFSLFSRLHCFLFNHAYIWTYHNHNHIWTW